MKATRTSTALLIIILILGAGVWLLWSNKEDKQAVNLPASVTPFEEVALETSVPVEADETVLAQADQTAVAKAEVSESAETKAHPATEDDIKNVVKKTFPIAKNVVIGERSELTADADLEMLVALGSGNSSGNEFTVVRFENGIPVVSKIREGGITKDFLYEVSVGTGNQNATALKLYPDQNAIVTTSYELFGDPTDNCEAKAYTWNSGAKVFDYNSSLSAQHTAIFKSECQKIADGFGFEYGN